MRIELTSVFVENPIEAFRFYTEVLGFQEVMFMPEAYIAIVASPEQPNGVKLLLEPRDDEIARPYQEKLWEKGLPCIIFGVDDIHAEFQRLSDRGVTFRGEPETSDYGTSVIFEDTFGNLIQLHQAP